MMSFDVLAIFVVSCIWPQKLPEKGFFGNPIKAV